MLKLNVGLFGIGNEAYWPQFDGLLDNLKEYMEVVSHRLIAMDINLVNLGMIDSPEKALDAGHKFRTFDVDLIIIHITTYALSHTVLPVIQRTKVPVIVLNLAPEKSINYKHFNSIKDRTIMTGKWLEFCSACPVPEVANVFRRSGINFYQVSGYLDEKYVWDELKEWIDAAKVAKIMSQNRVGCMGHYYNGMLDIYSDITNQVACFGSHFEMVEVDELSALRRDVKAKEIDDKVSLFSNEFDIQDDCSIDDLREAARTSIALDKLVQKHKLSALAYYYEGSGISENENTISSIILGNSLLTARGIPVAGEYEIKNVQAMKIMDSFGVGGSFTEFYAMDYNDDVVLMGHDGPGHIKIAESKTKVRPLHVYHGKVGKGLSVEMSVKNGPVTILSVVECREKGLRLLYAEGESVSGPIMEIGNTNSRYKFSIGARNFVDQWSENGPAHHCAVGIGHIGAKIEKLGQLLNLNVVKVA